MKHAMQPSKPEWWESDKSKLYEPATAGTSPFNEWWEFDSRKEAIGKLEDYVVSFPICDDDIYHPEDVVWKEHPEYGNFPEPKEGAKPVELSELVWDVSSVK